MPSSETNSCEKSVPPIAMPTTGMMMPSTSAVMILPKAAPMTTAIARSTTLPRAMKSLNSLTIPMRCPHSEALSAAESRLPRGAWRRDPAMQGDHVIETGVIDIADQQRTDPGRRAHEHQVASAQRIELRQFVQDLRHVPDQLI